MEKKLYNGRTHELSNSLFKNHWKSDFKMPGVEKEEEPCRNKKWNLKKLNRKF